MKRILLLCVLALAAVPGIAQTSHTFTTEGDHFTLDGKPFKDARELAGLLRQLPDTRTCLVRNFFRYSAGHVETPANEADIKAWDAVMSGSGNKLTSFLAEIAASDAFRLVSATP